MDQSFYEKMLNSISDGVYFIDLNRKVTYWNKAAERLSGYSAQEVLGKSCADNVLRHVDEKGTQLCVVGCPLAATMADGATREASVFMHHKFGHRIPVFVRASPMRDATGNIIGAVEMFSENSNRMNILKEMEALRKEVLMDPLTGVGNRRYADISLDRLEKTVKESKVPYGVIFVDIDFFKKVNDTWGHHAGDLVLTMVANTLGGSLRPLDVICRWGGEEFVILVPNTTTEGLTTTAERLRMLVESTWLDFEDDKIRVTASFGGAVSVGEESAVSVVDRADKQVYLSKEAGRNCIHINDEKVVPKSNTDSTD